MLVRLTINGTLREVEVDPRTPLLWVLRDTLGLTGTKYGCGIAQCGACTVHVDAAVARACAVTVGSVAGRRITTIEGMPGGRAHPLQRAWLAEQVPQCGYCQPGMLMGAAALIAERPQPSDADIDAALGGHICRCGTYGRIRRAVHRAADEMRQPASPIDTTAAPTPAAPAHAAPAPAAPAPAPTAPAPAMPSTDVHASTTTTTTAAGATIESASLAPRTIAGFAAPDAVFAESAR